MVGWIRHQRESNGSRISEVNWKAQWNGRWNKWEKNGSGREFRFSETVMEAGWKPAVV
jgi:hypothetical protein